MALPHPIPPTPTPCCRGPLFRCTPYPTLFHTAGPLWQMFQHIHSGRLLVDKEGGRRGYVISPRSHDYNTLDTPNYLVRQEGRVHLSYDGCMVIVDARCG